MAVACTPQTQTIGPPFVAPELRADTFQTADGTLLPLRSWIPHGKLKVVVVALHGMNDYSGSFSMPAEAWRRAGIAVYHQVRIVFGPGRHATSGAMFLYFEGPDSVVYEYSFGVNHVDGAQWRPRQFPFTPESFCVWGSRPDIPEFRKSRESANEK